MSAITVGARRRSSLLGILRFGLLQARIELVNRFTSWSALGNLVVPIVLVLIYSVVDIRGTIGVDSVRTIVAGSAVALLFVNSFVGIAGELVTEQDDGTMLRVRMLPNGLSAHLIGKVVSLLVTSLLTLLLILIPTQLLVGPVLPTTLPGWLGLLGVALLALVATVPLGAAAGSLLKSPVAVFPVSLIAYALVIVSGTFFPLDVLPAWLGGIVRVFPVYWLGELSRAVLLPEQTALGLVQTAFAIGVPLLWAILGLLLVPRALNTMTRRQSGSRLDEIRRRREVRGY